MHKMMRKLLPCLLAFASLLSAAPKKPKLVLAIVFDQFRYDYLTRFRGEYQSGLRNPAHARERCSPTPATFISRP